MNTVFHAAGESAQLGWLMGLTTVGFLLFFVAWTVWAFLPSNREYMERASRLPLEDDEVN